jgi:nitrogen fixation NifU-like protein
MTSDLEALYQRTILEHARRPANARLVDGARAAKDNPLCGDEVTVTVRLADGRVAEIGAIAEGCALSKAAASLMTLAVLGRSADEVRALDGRFRAFLAGGPDAELGDLAVFAGVARFPVRARCAQLAWDALRAALDVSAV